MVLILVSVQSRMARAALGWGVRDLAAAAGVSADTVARFERGDPIKPATQRIMREAFEAAGVIFVAENGEGPGARLRKQPAG